MADADSAPDSGVSMREALGDVYDQMMAAETPESTVPAESLVVDDEDLSTDSDEAAEETVESDETDEAPVSTAPKHWSEDRRALFDRADPEIQQAWLDREKEFDRGIQQKAQEAATLRQAIDPVREHIALMGMDEQAWLRQMAGYTLALRHDPAGVIRAVAQQYAVDLASLTGSQQADEDRFVDPDVKLLRDQVQTLQQQINASQQSAQQAAQSAQAQAIEAFRDEKGADGKAVRPHFDAVTDDMVVLANGYRAAGKTVPALAELYTAAVRMHPELTSQQTAQVRTLDAAAKAKRARSAAVRPSGGASGDPSKPKTLRDELSEAWDQANRGV